MGRLRARLRRAERKAQGDGIVLRLKDGTARSFDTMEIRKELFLTLCDLLRGTARDSEVLDTLRNATQESRRIFEERFDPVTICEHIIGASGRVETLTLTEDGEVERVPHEVGSEEAERIRREA
jgi:hypothetical protein